jgi:hypothetical protein
MDVELRSGKRIYNVNAEISWKAATYKVNTKSESSGLVVLHVWFPLLESYLRLYTFPILKICVYARMTSTISFLAGVFLRSTSKNYI